jgi:small-conductance mechanosensitive channel
MTALLPTPPALDDLLVSLTRPGVLIELALVLAMLTLAWVLVRLLHGRISRPGSVWFGDHLVDGVLFPVLALVLVEVSQRVLRASGQPLALFHLVVPVLVSLMLIRLAARVLRAAFPRRGWVLVVERSVSWLAWGGVVLWITGLLPAVLSALEEVRWKLGTSQVSLRTLIEGGITAAVVMVLALWVSAGIERKLLTPSLPPDAEGSDDLHAATLGEDLSLRKIAASLVRALLLFVGLLVALSAVGIDLTALGVLGGALGVGVGFGLQKLAANYVSGFVILAERSLRIGDIVKVDGFEGRITDIATRYTVIRALNGREAIVPNEMLITQRVENLSLADRRVATSTNVSVPYGTDLAALFPALVAAVAAVPRVLADPAPGVQLNNFGIDALDLSIGFWIADPDHSGGTRSDVNLAVLAELARLGVDIPYPQRVLHVKSLPQADSVPVPAAAAAPPTA